jgi:hypothetical protein
VKASMLDCAQYFIPNVRKNVFQPISLQIPFAESSLAYSGSGL